MPNSQLTSVKKTKLRNSEYYNMQQVFDNLYSRSLKGKSFTNLIEIIASDENIKLAYRNIKKNTGSTTSGVDGRTINDISKLSEEKFLFYTKNKFKDYKPKAVKRVEIPKPNGKLRPLGIPAIWDRIVQQCILQVLEPICEAKFYERSNGFRPNRSTENAMAQCYTFMQKQNLHYVVDIDIEAFFDNVNHAKLLKQLWSIGIRDKNLLTIISKMLKAKIKLPSGEIIENDKGTPQGGILSPLLSNIVLNEFDWWTSSQWETMIGKSRSAKELDRGEKGIDRGNKYKELRKSTLKECFIVRYADDFKIFCKDYQSARKMYFASKGWLKDRLGLSISQEKSKIVNLKKDYSEFLGFKMKVIKKGNRWIVKSHMCDKAKDRTKNNLKNILVEIKYPKGSNDEVRKIGLYNSTVIGIHQYFRIATMVSKDLSDIAYQLKHMMHNHKMNKRIDKNGIIHSPFIKKEYGKSKQIRYIRKLPIIPLAYIKHKNPMMKKRVVNQYTSIGREHIHKNLVNVDISMLRHLMENPITYRSIEYNDNRISLYSAQNGKCNITGKTLLPDKIHCHHKKPRFLGGTDEYRNLILVDKNIHILIHSNTQTTIEKYLKLVSSSKRKLDKLNKLRTSVGNQPINV
ncbi:group II intron reverse transcriptase/maturase [Clostridium sp. LCP25S3_F8]|uniref:group II intron reverse transcriptase/maturase n=1 Tax=Clostridium sp. LCP25S3_F8 TaxID=3438751 RepID=UPI003F8E0C58